MTPLLDLAKVVLGHKLGDREPEVVTVLAAGRSRIQDQVGEEWLERVAAPVSELDWQIGRPRQGLGSPDLLAPVPGGKNATESKGDRSGGSGNAETQGLACSLGLVAYRGCLARLRRLPPEPWIDIR